MARSGNELTTAPSKKPDAFDNAARRRAIFENESIYLWQGVHIGLESVDEIAGDHAAIASAMVKLDALADNYLRLCKLPHKKPNCE